MLSLRRLELARTFGPVVVDLEGLTLTSADVARLRHPMTGMVILFARNFASLAQLKELTAAVRAVRPGILIAVDHEGGRVQRFREGFTAIPPMAEIAAGPDAERRFAAAGYVIGAELAHAGVDFSFTPVLDIDYGRSGVIGDRAFGRTAETVARNARALIGGLAAAGLSACGKHFPGHGWAEADSHLAVPTDERTRDAILRDAEPYRALSAVLDAVMTAHVVYPAFSDEPATYVPELLQDVLRGKLGFDGLVFSDDLSMAGSITGRWAGSTPSERAVSALAAGCDMVLHCNHGDELDGLLDGVAARWTPTDAFAARLARLIPEETERPAPDEDPRWRAARALL